MSEINLPKGWCLTTIAHIAKVNPKKLDADPDTLSGFIPMSHAPTSYNGKLHYEVKPWDEIKKSYTNFKDGDVIVAKVTPCFENGKASIVSDLPNGIGAGSSEFYVIRPVSIEISTHFLFSIIKSQKFLQEGADNMTGAVGLRRVPRSFVENFPVSLPPSSEQKVISDKLDVLLAKVEKTKAHLERIPEILKTFRQSVLSAAVSGKLVGDNSNYHSIEVKENWAHEIIGLTHWQNCKFSDVIKIIGGSQPPKSEFSNEEKEGYIRLIQIRDYKSDAYKVYIPLEKAKRFVSKKDVMIGRYGPPIFQILRGLQGAYNVALMKAEPNTKILDREYLYWYLQNYKLFNYIDAGSDRTAGQTGVNKKYLESYPILVPSLEEQTKIVCRIEELFAFADNIEQKANAALERVNNLTQSILAKAFRGELTADWRAANPDLISGENSAESLLEKIKAERSKDKIKK